MHIFNLVPGLFSAMHGEGEEGAACMVSAFLRQFQPEKFHINAFKKDVVDIFHP